MICLSKYDNIGYENLLFKLFRELTLKSDGGG